MKYHKYKMKIIARCSNLGGIWFHIIGIASIIWFLVRVVPAPHRAKYPCQQMSITIAVGYITFWSVLFITLSKWIKRAKTRTAAVLPSFLVIFLMLFTFASPVFADNYIDTSHKENIWTPIPKEPIGTPKGVNPGRVVWVWDPNATEKDLEGYWWESENNNQSVIDQMYYSGITSLSDEKDIYDAWDKLFRYFNQVHGRGDIGYTPGEKIAIKINMNNGYFEPYDNEINDIDANPYVVKGLLHQLINVVGVPQEDIYVYDASRKLMDWFYNRVYYESYPSDHLVPEFPDVNFVDSDGGAPGRQKVIASSERVYFAEGPCKYRTLPTIVTEADYLINMPIVKRHVKERVTLAGKNWFGTWIEDVVSVHDYHTIGYSEMGNPAPQVDLLAHRQIGGKTLLIVGDGTYGCRYGNAEISHFQMYPFCDDWMSSLFFSQDSVAIDSVMYDFLYVEATGGGPSEGAQNYLHQAADPPKNVYDPEGDGIYLSESLGVHEHCDRNVDIFSPDRYSGPSNNGIDYVAIGKEYASPAITLLQPKNRHLYIGGNEVKYLTKLNRAIIIGKIDAKAEVYGITDNVEKVEFYLDGRLEYTDYEEPYLWSWNKISFFMHTLETVAYYDDGKTTSDSIVAWKFL